MSEQLSLLQMNILITVLDVGDATSRERALRKQPWDGKVPWRASQWFRDTGKTHVSRSLRSLEERGFIERFNEKGEQKAIGRGWHDYTRFVRLTPEGSRVARDAKFGRIAPMPARGRGE